MERKIYRQLENWKHNPHKMPLLLNGARQVGKTYAALTFGKRHYTNILYLNFEESPETAAIFQRDLTPKRILRELAAQKGVTILPKETLLIFDEIQACENALTSLKYFCEEAPEYHIIAAGSLLGVHVHRKHYSFPVGKVQILNMYPLDFEEFLWALGNFELAKLIREHFTSLEPFNLHAKALAYYKHYLVLGGMPRVIEEYLKTKDFNFALAIQKGLNDAYIADMAKYAEPQETAKILATWRSIPAQLAKENKKFQYKTIKTGARANIYAPTLDWLVTAGLIHKCVRVNEPSCPLSAFADNEAFKVYMMDTGLLCSKFDIAPQLILNTEHILDSYKGALAENYVMQSLVANGKTVYYWTKGSSAELDFMYQTSQGEIIPLECKSSEHVRARSLKQYMQQYQPPYGIRVSARNFGFENNIKSLPLYAVHCL